MQITHPGRAQFAVPAGGWCKELYAAYWDSFGGRVRVCRQLIVDHVIVPRCFGMLVHGRVLLRMQMGEEFFGCLRKYGARLAPIQFRIEKCVVDAIGQRFAVRKKIKSIEQN